MLYKPITLTVDALALILRSLSIGEPHITLAGAAVWTEPQTDRAALAVAWQVLADQGLCHATGLDPGLCDSLAILSRPGIEYYGWLTHQGVTEAVLAAAIGGDAVLAIRRGSRIRLAPADPARLAETLIGYLPAVSAGRGLSVNLPVGKVRAEAGRSGGAPVAERVLEPVRPVSSPSMRAFARLARLPATGAGELYTAMRSRGTGRRVGLGHAISYQDTVEGRWLVQMVRGPDDDWVVVAPATSALLLSRLDEAHRGLAHDFHW